MSTPSDIFGAVKTGIDMFDCVLPTRSGRTGLAFTWEGKLNLKILNIKFDKSPLDQNIKTKFELLFEKLPKSFNQNQRNVGFNDYIL